MRYRVCTVIGGNCHVVNANRYIRCVYPTAGVPCGIPRLRGPQRGPLVWHIHKLCNNNTRKRVKFSPLKLCLQKLMQFTLIVVETAWRTSENSSLNTGLKRFITSHYTKFYKINSPKRIFVVSPRYFTSTDRELSPLFMFAHQVSSSVYLLSPKCRHSPSCLSDSTTNKLVKFTPNSKAQQFYSRTPGLQPLYVFISGKLGRNMHFS